MKQQTGTKQKKEYIKAVYCHPAYLTYIEYIMRNAWLDEAQAGIKTAGRCVGEGNGNPFQYSCLENPRDRGTWWAAVYGVAQSWTRLKRLSSSSSMQNTSYINGDLDEVQAGIQTAGRNVNNLSYADDTILMAESEEELKNLLMKVQQESEKPGLKLNIQKTKIMASDPITSWQI